MEQAGVEGTNMAALPSASAVAVTSAGGGVGGNPLSDYGRSLQPYIDTPRVRVLNAIDDDSGAHCLKAWDKRLSELPSLRSNDDDTDLLLYVPFTTQVVLKSLCVRGGARGSAPERVRVFVNRDDLDFDTAARTQPAQAFDLPEDRKAEIEHPTRVARFQNVSSLTFFFQGSHGADFSEICFLGLSGTVTENKLFGAVEFVYEARANIADHPEAAADAKGAARGVQ